MFLFVGCTKEPVQLRDAHPATLGHVRHSHSRPLREPLQNRRARGVKPTKIFHIYGGQEVMKSSGSSLFIVADIFSKSDFADFPKTSFGVLAVPKKLMSIFIYLSTIFLFYQ
jgi:hypothetical protein